MNIKQIIVEFDEDKFDKTEVMETIEDALESHIRLGGMIVKENKKSWGNIDLGKAMAREIKNKSNMTLDEFYDKYKIPENLRCNFGTAAIMNKAIEILEKEKK